jgi:mannonate dehydratase
MIERRTFLSRFAAGAALGASLMGCRALGAKTQEAAVPGPKPPPGPESPPGQPSGLKISRVRSILTAPEGIRLVVVKVETSEPGLWGLGCATFTQRARAVAVAVDQFLDPFLRGKDPANIEDLWQAMYQSSYWRNGPVLMNALSGVDMALWDILAKRAGMPVYQILGGKCRTAVPAYAHASGPSPEAVEEAVRRFMAEGFRYIRVQVGVPGMRAYGSGRDAAGEKDAGQGHFSGRPFEPAAYQRVVPALFAHLSAPGQRFLACPSGESRPPALLRSLDDRLR